MATLRSHAAPPCQPLAAPDAGVPALVVIITRRRTSPTRPVSHDGFEDGARVRVIGSGTGVDHPGCATNALQTHCRISVVAVPPVVLPVLAPAPGA